MLPEDTQGVAEHEGEKLQRKKEGVKIRRERYGLREIVSKG